MLGKPKDKEENLNLIRQSRESIDQIHEQIIDLLSQRVLLTEKIWQAKDQLKLPEIDPSRENQILLNIHNHQQTLKNPEFKNLFLKVFEVILNENKNILNQRRQNSHE